MNTPKESMNDLFVRVMRGDHVFTPEVVYDASADCVTYFHEDAAVNGDWIDPFVTIYWEIQSGRPVGFKVKCVRTIVAAIAIRDATVATRAVTFEEVVDAAAKLSKDAQSKAREREQVRNSELAGVEIPREAYA